MNSLKPVEQELAKLQKQTATEQRNWRSQKGKLVREISGLKIKQTDLIAKNTQLTKQLVPKQAEIERLEQLSGTLEGGIKAKHKAFDKLARQHKSKTAEIQALDEQIKAKKASLDTELADYRQSQVDIIDSELKPLRDELDSLNQQLKDLKLALGQARNDLAALEAQKDTRSAQIDKELADKQAEAGRLGQLLDELQDAIDELETKQKQLLYDRDQAISATNKARIEYQQFIKYEQKARDALNAKDKSLQLREDEVEKTSVMMRNARSNLPSM